MGCFIVDIGIKGDNEITVTVDNETGSISMDDCVMISNEFEKQFDRNSEDYSLTVTSAGLDQPFKILKQFEKAMGTSVEVWIKGGQKITGILVKADEKEISVKHEVTEKAENKKKKYITERTDTFLMSEVNSVKPSIEL